MEASEPMMPDAWATTALGHVEHAHDEVPGVGDEQNRGGGFEHPFEDHPGVHIMQVVAVGYHLDQLQRHHDGQDYACNRHMMELERFWIMLKMSAVSSPAGSGPPVRIYPRPAGSRCRTSLLSFP